MGEVKICKNCENMILFDVLHTSLDNTERVIPKWEKCVYSIDINNMKVIKCSHFKLKTNKEE